MEKTMCKENKSDLERAINQNGTIFETFTRKVGTKNAPDPKDVRKDRKHITKEVNKK